MFDSVTTRPDSEGGDSHTQPHVVSSGSTALHKTISTYLQLTSPFVQGLPEYFVARTRLKVTHGQLALLLGQQKIQISDGYYA